MTRARSGDKASQAQRHGLHLLREKLKLDSRDLAQIACGHLLTDPETDPEVLSHRGKPGVFARGSAR